MRYGKECTAGRPYFGFYVRLYPDTDTDLYDEVFRGASELAGKNALHNKEFILTLLQHFKDTAMAGGKQ